MFAKAILDPAKPVISRLEKWFYSKKSLMSKFKNCSRRVKLTF
jgi:hypothetical protein